MTGEDVVDATDDEFREWPGVTRYGAGVALMLLSSMPCLLEVDNLGNANERIVLKLYFDVRAA